MSKVYTIKNPITNCSIGMLLWLINNVNITQWGINDIWIDESYWKTLTDTQQLELIIRVIKQYTERKWFENNVEIIFLNKEDAAWFKLTWE